MSSSSSDSSTSTPSKDKEDAYIIVVKQRDSLKSTLIALFIIAWVVTGLAAHFTALACLGGGGFWENMWGLLIAVFLGPIFFIYFYLMKGNKNFCYYGRS
jgi:hypothetical protein